MSEPSSVTPSRPCEEEEDENPFSQYYGMLLHQQNMLQDHVRTGTYERAMLSNPSTFRDKVVLDVGTGSGILAFFAIKAGARKVYAVEVSHMAECARQVVAANGLRDAIVVVKGKMEDVELPEPVDVVVSEPMGFCLVHERMLETFVAAGQKWRRPGPGFTMFPSVGTLFLAPFTDDTLYRDQMAKVAFWHQTNFYGVNLSSLGTQALHNHFSQPVVGYFAPEILLSSRPAEHVFDFASVTPAELECFDFPFRFVIERTAMMHGLGCWFTVDFVGANARIVLSTAPHDAGTHWYQCRFLLPTPIAVNATQSVSGNLHFVANKKFSYDIDVEVRLDDTSIVATNHIHLHDQMYHYLYSSGAGVAKPVTVDDMQ
ncbi:hypothetical protein PsorP6_013540 [Peronosclerospora sorghi]|uniref:Uncharacterized protein n=1 Tax=Peronosclerospora sorghi TaxID=230839 RepID=A0ACC0VFT7_9STRA|nr:hypothetical protein PsorP6_013540 [Peronosclerospora sorghi]